MSADEEPTIKRRFTRQRSTSRYSSTFIPRGLFGNQAQEDAENKGEAGGQKESNHQEQVHEGSATAALVAAAGLYLATASMTGSADPSDNAQSSPSTSIGINFDASINSNVSENANLLAKSSTTRNTLKPPTSRPARRLSLKAPRSQFQQILQGRNISPSASDRRLEFQKLANNQKTTRVSFVD